MHTIRILIALALAVASTLASAITYVDRSGTINTGGTSQTLAAANPTRGRIVISNPSTESEVLCVNVTSAASCTTPGSWLLQSGETIVLDSTELITVVAATTGHKFTAKEGVTEGFARSGGGGGSGGGSSGVSQGSTTSGQSGTLIQCATTTSSPTYSNGTTNPCNTDTSGAIRVVITGGAGSGGTSSNFGSATPSAGTAAGFSDGTNMQAARVADIDSGAGTQYAVVVTPRISASGGGVEFTAGAGAVAAGTQRVTLASDDPAVAGIGGVSDAAATQGSTGSVSAKLRTVTSQLNTGNTSLSSIDGKLVGGAGAVGSSTLRTTQASDSPLVAATGAQADSAAAADTSTASLIALTKRNNQNLTTINSSLATLNTSVNTAANYEAQKDAAVPTRLVAMGARIGANADAVPMGATTTAINVSTATTTQLVALSGSTKIYVTGVAVVAGGTGNITFVYGTGSNCGTGTTSLSGAIPLIANAGLTLGGGLGAVLVVPAGQALCVTTSAAVQMSGFVTYAQY